MQNGLTSNNPTRTNIEIQLLNDDGQPVASWTLDNAWVTKFSDSGLNSDGEDVAIDLVEVACEGIKKR